MTLETTRHIGRDEAEDAVWAGFDDELLEA